MAANLLICNVGLSPVCRSIQGKNRGKASCIVLTISRVRSAVYRSIPNRKRGRKPSESNLFFCAYRYATNAYYSIVSCCQILCFAHTFSAPKHSPNTRNLHQRAVRSRVLPPAGRTCLHSSVPQYVIGRIYGCREGGVRLTSGLFQASRNKSAFCSGEIQI